MRSRSIICGFILTVLLLTCSALGQDAAKPIVEPGNWNYNDYWKTLRIGDKDFWLTEVGVWTRHTEENVERLKQTGFYNRTIPGYMPLRAFVPDTNTRAVFTKLAGDYVKNGWPFQSIDYIVFKGKVNVSDRISPEVRNLWIGDGQPEQTYRLEPVFHYFRTGKKWRGSSMNHWDDKQAEAFFRDKVMPRVKKELPFWDDEKHKWTHEELQKVSAIYVDAFWEDRMPLVWGMFVANFHMAMNMDVRAVGEKGATPFHAARARGMMRQGGGNMMFSIWRGHEPTERYAYPTSHWYTTRGDDWGMPFQLMPYYFFRPYLIGGHHMVVESYPGTGIMDIEGDGQYELTPIGHIGKELLDFVERHPERGTVYTPVGLMIDQCRNVGRVGTSHNGYNLPFDDADQMNYGIVRDLLYPEPTHTRFSGDYFGAAPYGEIFDILKPNTPTIKDNLSRKKLLANYKLLIAMGGIKLDKTYAADLQDYVRNGGVLAITAEDAAPLPESFLGCKAGDTFEAKGKIVSAGDGKEITENPFTAHALTLTSAKAIYTLDGKPMVTINKVGKGKVLVLAPRYLIQNEKVTTISGRGRTAWKQKPLLKFVAHLMDRLTQNATPIKVTFPEKARPNTGYVVMKKGDGWTVSLFNYSLERELVARTLSTAKVSASYPPKAIPFEITCNAPVNDIVEWYEDRDVTWKKVGGKAVIKESIRGGQILVYEFQPKRIDLGTVKKPINYALNKPVKASSHRPGFEPKFAVDGDTDNDNYWWSNVGKGRGKGRKFEMPQTLEVDLRRVRTIDHVKVIFHIWPKQSLHTRLRIYKYIVEASEDGKVWKTVLDERQNMNPAQAWGLERWFEPTQAQYVRLKVLHNTAFAGAQVVEFKVMGVKKKAYPIDRKSLVPKYEVQYPEFVKKTPKAKQKYLFDMKTAGAPKIGWMPAGTTWKQLCGPIKLTINTRSDGRVYEKSLYAQAHSEITYNIPKGAKTFASAIGQGSYKRDASIIFKVYVDDKLKFESPLYRLGMPVLPAVVDVAGGKKLKLVVTDGGDSIRNDYAWWGEARFLMK
jgi:NPCBM/NEW2 domain/F5/8 type C domain